jgi:hypothetical protein
MQTATEYLAKTGSAVRHLFEGIDAYHNLLRSADIPVLVRDEPFGIAVQAAEQEAWEIRNAERFAATWHAEKKFIAELFAMDTLCGAVLQVANNALDLYGKDGSIPPEWGDVVKKGSTGGVGSYARCHLVLSSTQHATNTPTSTIQNRVC